MDLNYKQGIRSMTFKKIFIVLLLLIISWPIYPKFFGINFFRPWDPTLRPERWPDAPWQITSYLERGLKSTGFNPDNDKVNVMQIWTPTQDAIAMLKGFGPNSPETQFLENNLPNVQDNGIRGNFSVTGDFHLNASAAIIGRYNFCGDVVIGLYLPFYAMKLNNVAFADLTPSDSNNPQDILVKERLMDNFSQLVQQLDPSLNLRGWSRAGVGDLVATAEWLKYFPQNKPYLKNVGVNARIGLTFPTGKRQEIDDILSIPFGFDGSFGLFGDAAIMVNWFNRINAGINFEFIYLFGQTKLERIKTDPMQTDFLFLAKAPAHTEYGFTQFYDLFLQARLFRGFSAGFAYQFWKHSEDKLVLATNAFSNNIANTAENLQEWTIHQIIFNAWYDCSWDVPDYSWIKPQVQFFYKMPFNGKRAILVHTIGFGITLSF